MMECGEEPAVATGGFVATRRLCHECVRVFSGHPEGRVRAGVVGGQLRQMQHAEA